MGSSPLPNFAVIGSLPKFTPQNLPQRIVAALNQRIVALAGLATMVRAIELFELRCRSRPDDAVEQGTATNRAERQTTDRERFAVPHPQHDILDQGVPHELRTL